MSRDSLSYSFLRDLPINKLSLTVLHQAFAFIQQIPLPLMNWHGFFIATKIVPKGFYGAKFLHERHLIDLKCQRHELILPAASYAARPRISA